MAKDKKKDNAVTDQDPTADALVQTVNDAMGDNIPKDAKPFINWLLGMAAQWASNWVGTKSRDVTLKLASKRTTAENANRISVAGDMVGRSLITTVLPNVVPAWKLFAESRERKNKFREDFSAVLKSEGAKSGLFGGVRSDLEAIRFQSQHDAQVASLKRKGLLTKFFKQLVPDTIVSAGSMVITEIKNYSRYDSLKKDEASLGREEKETLRRLEKERNKQGPEAVELRDIAAKKTLKWFEKRLGNIMPGENGFSDTQNEVYDHLQIPGVGHGDFTLPRGVGRANYLIFLRDIAGVAYKSLSAWLPFLDNMFKDTATPQATALLKQTTALKMIKALEKPFSNDATPMRVNNLPGATKANSLVSDYVFDIFVKHRSDMKFQPLSETHKRKLHDACEVIAAAMQDGNRRLSAQALTYLIDSKQGIIEYEDGKISGVKRGAELEKAIQALITDRGLTDKPKVKLAEYYHQDDKGGAVHFARVEMLESWNKLSKEEQQVWSTNFPDEVLVDITGDKTYARELRLKQNDLWQEMFQEIASALKDIPARQQRAAGIDSDLEREVERIAKDMRTDPQGSQIEAMQITAEIGVRMEIAEPGFISDVIAGAKKRKSKQDGLDEELDEEVEQNYHREKVGKREKADISAKPQKDTIKEIVGDKEKAKRSDHRLGKRPVEADERYV